MTYEEFIKVVEPHKNTLVLDGFDVVKLAGTCRDEVDYYYILFDKQGKEYHLSAVGGVTYLKGFINQRDYNQKVWQWNEFFKMKLDQLIVE